MPLTIDSVQGLLMSCFLRRQVLLMVEAVEGLLMEFFRCLQLPQCLSYWMIINTVSSAHRSRRRLTLVKDCWYCFRRKYVTRRLNLRKDSRCFLISQIVLKIENVPSTSEDVEGLLILILMPSGAPGNLMCRGIVENVFPLPSDAAGDWIFRRTVDDDFLLTSLPSTSEGIQGRLILFTLPSGAPDDYICPKTVEYTFLRPSVPSTTEPVEGL